MGVGVRYRNNTLFSIVNEPTFGPVAQLNGHYLTRCRPAVDFMADIDRCSA
jgi:hypothetical protein